MTAKIDPEKLSWTLSVRSPAPKLERAKNGSPPPTFQVRMRERGDECFVTTDEALARIVAAAPAMLRFFASVTLRPNAPTAIDANRLLSLAGIEIERAAALDAPSPRPRPATLAVEKASEPATKATTQFDNYSDWSILRVLERVEWYEAEPGSGECPCCGYGKASGHSADCALSWHLAELRKRVLNRPGEKDAKK